MIQRAQVERLIKIALQEDMNNGDITTDMLIESDKVSEAKLIVKQDGVLAGIKVFESVFEYLDNTIQIEWYKQDGEEVCNKEQIASILGSTRCILKGERIALNLLQRLSGIATITRQMVKEVEDINVRVVDTRKTTPGFRVLEKYAVRMGGGHNHRFNLSDAVLIKDNHIQAVGSIKRAVCIARERLPHTMKIEVEVETLMQLQEALDAKVDIVMLDNMCLEDMRKAVSMKNKNVILEASGNVTLQRIREIARTGIDIISCGALTHSAKSLDISLKF